MKKMITLIITWMLILTFTVPVYAQDGNVTYDGNAQEFVFAPGSNYSPTDLFLNFKGVMPGDSITQKITVKNDASNDVKVKIYMRALGAHEDSVDFLSQLSLRVEKVQENEAGYMFDAAASEKAQLTDWVCLGTLYSGGEVDLNVILDVPVELDNQYSSQIGMLDWEFMVEEFQIEKDDPQEPEKPQTPGILQPTKTGDNSQGTFWMSIMACSMVAAFTLLWLRRKSNN